MVFCRQRASSASVLNQKYEHALWAAVTIRLEPRPMRLLLYLAAHPGRVVDEQELLDEVWPNVVVTQGSVYQAVAQLRRILGDDSEHPKYIETSVGASEDLHLRVSEPGAVEPAARAGDAAQHNDLVTEDCSAVKFSRAGSAALA